MDDFVIDASAAFRKAVGMAAAAKVVPQEMKRAGDRCGLLFKGRAFRAARKRTKFMANSIGAVTSVSGVSAVTRVYCNVPYAKAQDTGSRPHVIVPRRAKILAWKGAGGTIFARRVNHPGTTGNRFFTGSFEDLKPAFRKEFAAVPRRVIAAIKAA